MPFREPLPDASESVTPTPTPPALIPRPLHLTAQPGAFILTAETVIQTNGPAFPEAESLAERLRAVTGFPLPVQEEIGSVSPRLELFLDGSARELGPEGYRLQVTSTTITLRAAGAAGLFYAGQTLLQLLPSSATPGVSGSIALPCLEIEDRPRFAWRGILLDVARHFAPIAFLKRFIDLLALHKLNTLQLHLTDDQGWRIEIKKYPRLTEIGAYRKETVVGLCTVDPASDAYDPANSRFDGVPYGGYYTQEEIREIVAYARTRHITIIPEIDMPGHAQAAIAAYPELGSIDQPLEVSTTWGIHPHLYNPLEPTIHFLQDVLQEVVDLFPSRFIHLGGDEAVKKQWRENPAIQARMQALGLPDEEALQGYFLQRMAEVLSANGRRLIGWDEILEGELTPDAVITSWRGEKGGVQTAQAGHDVVMAPHTHTYFDYYQSDDRSREPQAFPDLLPLSTVYHYEPIPADLSEEFAHHILGAQGQLWSEYMPTTRQVEYMAFPRAAALAEVLWSARNDRDFASFQERLETHRQRLDALQVNYRRPRPEEG